MVNFCGLLFRVLFSRGCELLLLCHCDALFFFNKADAILHSAHKAGCVERESEIERYLDTLDTLLYWKEFATDTTLWLFTDG